MTNDKVKIRIQAFLTAELVLCLRRRWYLRERPPHQVRFDDGGRKDTLTMYMWDLSLTLFHVEGELELFPSFSCLLSWDEKGDIPADRAGTLKGLRAQTTPQEEAAEPPIPAALALLPSLPPCSWHAGRVRWYPYFLQGLPDLLEVTEHANLGAPSASLGWRTRL